MQYPPIVALTNGIVRARTLGDAMADAATVVQGVKACSAGHDLRVLGPAPAPFVKLRGEHRAQFFVKGAGRAAIRDAVRRALDAEPELRRRVAIDVDPMTVL
jgi:primosomal protein N' (replication factor Y)